MDLISEDSKEEEVDFEVSDTSVRLDSQVFETFDIESFATTSSSDPVDPAPAPLSPSNPTPTLLSIPSTTLTTMSGITGSSGSSGGSGGLPASSPSSSAPSSTKPPLPRVGGHIQLGSEWIPFSGGGLHDANRKDRPLAALAFRPTTDLRSLMRVEESSSKPLEEPKRIDEGTSPVTFAHWLNDIQRHFSNTGLDSVSYVLKPTVASSPMPSFDGTPTSLSALKAATLECDLFNDWGSITKDEIVAFDTWIKVNGDEIDQNNNQYARQFLRGSVGPILRDRIDRELDIDVSGTRMLYFIIRKLQAVSATSGRQLVEDLQAIKLSAVAGCHVTDCAEKIHNLCTKIHGLGSAHIPPDLPLLVVRCFDTTGIGSFDLEVTKIENQLDDDPTSLPWKDVLDKLTHKFDTLRLTKRWPPLLVDSKGKAAASGFAVQIDEVRKTINDVKSQIGSLKNKGSSNGTMNTGRDLSHVQCHYCKEKGHYKSDCPALKRKNEATESIPKDNSNKTKNWKRVPPKEGDSDTKTMTEDGKQVKFKWCSKCRRWNSGAKMHTTMEHKPRKKENDNSTPSPSHGNSLVPTRETVSFGLFSGVTGEKEFDIDEDVCSTAFLQKLFASSSTGDSALDCDGSNWYPKTFEARTLDESKHSTDLDYLGEMIDEAQRLEEHEVPADTSLPRAEADKGQWTRVKRGTPIKNAVCHPNERAGRN